MKNYRNIHDRVESLCRKYDTRNVFEICAAEKIRIITHQLGEKLKAYSIRVKKQSVIVLNESMRRELRQVVCAHELGHLILHPQEGVMMSRASESFAQLLTVRTEWEANAFAAELLMPDDSFLECIRSEGRNAETIAKLYSVPAELVWMKAACLRSRGADIHECWEVSSKFLGEHREEWLESEGAM